jgi:uncharacterized protein YdhG (YjbR/CyaY superfamily)
MQSKKVRFASIDQYIATFPKETQKRMQELRAIIKSAAPKAEENISYHMPAFAQEGNLVLFAGYKNHIGLYGTSTVTRPFKKQLAIYESGKDALRFPVDKPLPAALIKRIVKLRVAENLKNADKRQAG